MSVRRNTNEIGHPCGQGRGEKGATPTRHVLVHVRRGQQGGGRPNEIKREAVMRGGGEGERGYIVQKL